MGQDEDEGNGGEYLTWNGHKVIWDDPEDYQEPVEIKKPAPDRAAEALGRMFLTICFVGAGSLIGLLVFGGWLPTIGGAGVGFCLTGLAFGIMDFARKDE